MIEKLKTYFALKNSTNKSFSYTWNSPVFLFANENIQSYLGQMTNMTDKKVLTVAASGDHAFEALLAGAKHVDTFDINFLQKHVMELKSKMIKHLPYSDFMKFFFDKKHFFDVNIVKPIWETLSSGLRVFLLMHHRHKYSHLFRYDGAQHPDYRTDMISYVNDELAYNELKKIMPDKINFTRTNIVEITKEFHEEYDIVMLSNIFEYMYPDIFDAMTRIQTLHSELLCPICEKILSKDNGKICFHYAWDSGTKEWEKAIKYMQRHASHSIDDFHETIHTFETIRTPSVCTKPLNNDDLMIYMTQRQR